MADDFRALVERNRTNIAARLAGWITIERFMAMIEEVFNDPDLRKCTNESKLRVVLQAADAGVAINTADKHAVAIAYGDQAELQIEYQGMIYRLVEAGVVSHIYAELVFEKDEFEMISGTQRKLVHKPKMFGDRGKMVGSYSVATLTNGVIDFEVMELGDIKAIKNAALRMAQRRKKDAGMSPAWNFFEGEMAKKSVIRRHAKRLQGNRKDDASADRLAATMAVDNQQFDFETTARPVSDDQEEDLPRAPEAEATIKVKPEPKTEGPIGGERADELFANAAQLGLSPSRIMAISQNRFGVNPHELTETQVQPFLKALNEAAHK